MKIRIGYFDLVPESLNCNFNIFSGNAHTHLEDKPTNLHSLEKLMRCNTDENLKKTGKEEQQLSIFKNWHLTKSTPCQL